MSHSALYEGEVWHRRHTPRAHAFRYRLYLLYLDLEELPTLFSRRWLWSLERRNLVCFRRADYLGPAGQPLREAVHARVEQELGFRPRGRVRLLTQLRTLGFLSNPVSFYFCFDRQERLEAIVAEITNTPWAERFAYVLDARGASEAAGLSWQFDKRFHVSPFHSMQQQYEWCFSHPGERLELRMRNRESGELVFEAGLSCARRPITGRSLARVLLRHPWMSLRVHLAIYWQAARLFLLRTPFHTHPRERDAAPQASP